jgi:hypothetical protein
MNTSRLSNLSRGAYRLVVRVHPEPFRKRFGAEMLWIFDEECSRNAAGLLMDGMVSMVRQHCKEQDEIEPAAGGFTVGIPTSGMSLRRFLQGGLLASAIAYGIMLLISWNGVAIPPVHAAAHSCSTAIEAPSRISYPPKPPGR